MKKIAQIIALLCLVLVFTNCSNDDDNSDTIGATPPAETVTDADGNVYNTVTIGDQIWMVENLKTTSYKDGTPITMYSFAIHGNDWLNFNSPEAFYQWASTDDLNDVIDEELPFDYYGAMYNHLAIETGNLAPEGWRIPTQQDFIELENFISNDGNAGEEGTALKSETGWIDFSGNGTDTYGFNALPNGYVNALGGPTASEAISTWVTTNVNTTNQTRKMVSLFDEGTISYFDNGIAIGAAIRCIKE